MKIVLSLRQEASTRVMYFLGPTMEIGNVFSVRFHSLAKERVSVDVVTIHVGEILWIT